MQLAITKDSRPACSWPTDGRGEWLMDSTQQCVMVERYVPPHKTLDEQAEEHLREQRLSFWRRFIRIDDGTIRPWGTDTIGHSYLESWFVTRGGWCRSCREAEDEHGFSYLGVYPNDPCTWLPVYPPKMYTVEDVRWAEQYEVMR